MSNKCDWFYQFLIYSKLNTVLHFMLYIFYFLVFTFSHYKIIVKMKLLYIFLYNFYNKKNIYMYIR